MHDINAAYKLCGEFIKALPQSQHGYRSKAELEMIKIPGKRGIEAAKKTLRGALDNGYGGAQCALALADVYFEESDYDNAISAASRAILESAEEQPSINVASVFAKRGFAYDRLFMSKMTEIGNARKAIEDFEMASQLGGSGLSYLSPVVAKQVLTRLVILKSYLPDTENETE